MRIATLVFISVLIAGAGPHGALASTSQAPQPARPALPEAPPDVAAAPADAEKTASGLMFKILQPGSGDSRPRSADMVTIEYTGWTTDGKAFDSTVARGRPSTMSLERIMKGMSEAIQMMTVGEKRRLWMPEAIAFAGVEGRPKGTIVMDVELVGFEPSPTQAPPDVAAPPSDAKRTASGLAYRVIRPGTGDRRPSSGSRVTVHYTGWTTDGKMFDSSVTRGKPATFGLDQVIKGWTEGVQLMVIGEKTRFWIPERIAYGGQGNGPRGMLVFDIELIEIDK